MELLRKPIHNFHGISVYEIKELGTAGFQYKYQILGENGIPITEKYSSLDYVMSIYQKHVQADFEQLLGSEEPVTKIKQ